jgi:hypothetical protein
MTEYHSLVIYGEQKLSWLTVLQAAKPKMARLHLVRAFSLCQHMADRRHPMDEQK